MMGCKSAASRRQLTRLEVQDRDAQTDTSDRKVIPLADFFLEFSGKKQSPETIGSTR